MSIGYACLALGVPNTDIKGCMLKNASEEKLAELIGHNLSSLKNMIDFNAANDIRLFRISSDIIPFGSSPVNTLRWKDIYKHELAAIGNSIRKADIRVSMHPGQYTVLNSPDPHVAKRAAEDLAYHSSFLDSLDGDGSNKIILHVGGVYGDKKAAMRLFAVRFKDLDNIVKRRIVIENDDKSYNIGDVLELGVGLGIPVVYDTLHNKVNCSDASKDDAYWVRQCASSWQEGDGQQKIHYSQQDTHKKAGSHSASIAVDEFLPFFESLGSSVPDIMLEVKDKNLSAIKCINSTVRCGHIKALELEWRRYKYAVLEKSPNDYQRIRVLLKDKSSYPATAFYRAIEHAYEQTPDQGNCMNAALHVWGYFKHLAGEAEKKRFLELLQQNKEHSAAYLHVKRYLMKMAAKYDQEYLLSSYYFL